MNLILFVCAAAAIFLPISIQAESFTELAVKGEEAKELDIRLAAFTQALDAWKPSDTELRKAVILNSRGVEYRRLGDSDKALSDFSAAIESDPGNAKYRINRCGVRAQKKQYEMAMLDCTRAIEIDPGLAEGYFNRAQIFRLTDDHIRALKDYDKALSLSRHAPWFSIRGRLYEKHNEPIKALQDYTRAIEADPNYQIAWTRRGLLHARDGRPDMASGDFERALQLDPNDQVILQMLVSRTVGVSVSTHALPYLERTDDPSLNNLIIRARMHGRLGNLQVALNYYDRAISLDPRNVVALIARSGIFERMGNPEKEMADLNSAIAVSTAAAYPFYSRGNAYFLRGLLAEAEGDALSARPLGSEQFYGNTLLGRILLERGDLDGARKHLRAALAQSPDWPPVTLWSALAAFKAGSLDGARTHWKRCLELSPLLSGGLSQAEKEGYSFSEREKAIFREMLTAFSQPKRE